VNLYFLQGLSRKLSRQTYMSELIVLICLEMGTRRLQRTLEDTTPKRELRGCQVGPDSPTTGCLAPGATCHPPPHYVDCLPPPRLHLHHSLSWFQPRAHHGRFDLYILAKSARDVWEASPHGCSQGTPKRPDCCDERCPSTDLELLMVTQRGRQRALECRQKGSGSIRAAQSRS